MKKQIIGQQGEVRIIKINEMPVGIEPGEVERIESGFVISHSESGHHHVLTGGEVIERKSRVPEGMQIFYAILDNPESFVQDAASPHGSFKLDPGIYEFRVSREFDPFAEIARRVVD